MIKYTKTINYHLNYHESQISEVQVILCFIENKLCLQHQRNYVPRLCECRKLIIDTDRMSFISYKMVFKGISDSWEKDQKEGRESAMLLIWSTAVRRNGRLLRSLWLQRMERGAKGDGKARDMTSKLPWNTLSQKSKIINKAEWFHKFEKANKIYQQ